ncbi:MAG: hypothetical protein CL661_05120 [Bacteroidetes bacterium]|nr:hypothetical protein [Bacteroidota bacterium]|tara:strand:- start:139 stop:1215 length:1077 start_codon:yes stop_codon:yes gene_type:complete
MTNSGIQSHSNSSALTLAAYLIIIGIAMYASSIITPILLALFITIVCAQPIRWLEKRRVPNGIAVLIILLVILLFFFGMAELIGRSVSQFSKDVPLYEARLSELTTGLFNTLHSMGFEISIDKMENMINPSKIMNFTAGFLSALGSIMGNMILILFIIIFMLLELNSFSVKVNAIIKTSVGSVSYFKRIDKSIRQYLGLMTIMSLLTGVLVWIALTIIGVKYAILWALLAFVLNFIPNIGSIIASIPAIIFALIQIGGGAALWTLGSYVAINMTIGSIIQPQIMGKGLGLSTLVVFISLIFWGFVFGTIGMFLSVPLTMVVKIILEQKESTKWIAIMLGTEKEAQVIVEHNKSQLDNS